jgi:hypothetical protein
MAARVFPAGAFAPDGVGRSDIIASQLLDAAAHERSAPGVPEAFLCSGCRERTHRNPWQTSETGRRRWVTIEEQQHDDDT